MDVTCDRCKAEYEFDEALLGERGTTVKCSACGHVFRVLPPTREAGRSPLQLRYAKDGSLRGLSSLRELQQRIRAGEVSLDDELGREGFPFRALRDVPELKNFFLSQPGRHERSTVKPEGPYPRPDAAATRMPIHPESISPPPEPQASESEQPEAPTIPPPLPGTPEREAMDARRRASTERAQQAVADQREANKTIPAPAGIPPEQRARSFRHGTIHGVGEMQLPPPPRMPEFGPKPKPAPAPAQAAQPASNKANPHAKTLPPPGTGTVTGLPGLKPHQTLYGTPNTQPEAHPTSGVPTGSTHPMANRASERPPSALPKKPEQAPEPTRQHLRADEVELPKPTSEPERFPQFKAVPAQRAPSAPPRKLYLDADEKAPPRATEGSRAWLYVALLLLAAGGGGWFGMTRLRVSGKAALQPAPEAPRAIANDAADAAASAIEPGPSDAPAENAGPSGAAPPEKTAAPFAPPVPELEEELARRTGERPDKTAPPEAEAPKPEAKPVPAKPEQAAASKPEKAAAAPAEKPVPAGKLDRLARAERAAAANPQDYSAQLNRADALFAKGDNEGAQQAYRQALALRPTGSEANSGMGFALLKDGKASDSLPFFDRAANSGYAEANIGLGDAYRVLGQPSSAKEAYQAYLERLPTGARAEYARTWLDKLSGGSGNKAPERGAEPETYRPAGELTQPPQ